MISCVHFRIHGVIVSSITLDQAYDLIDKELGLVGLADKVKSREIIYLTDQYLGGSYGAYTNQDAGLSL